MAGGRRRGVLPRPEVGLGLAHHLGEGVQAADRSDRVVNRPVGRNREGLPVQLLEAGADDRERLLEHRLQGLALDASDWVLRSSPLRVRRRAPGSRHLHGAGAGLALARLGAGGHADRLLNRPHVHSQPAGQSARVLGAQRSILDVGDDAGGGAQALHSPLGAAKIHLGQDGTNREFKQRGARVHQVNDRLVSRRQPKLARVLAARGDSHERLRRKVLVLPVRAQRSLAPGAVAVKGEDHLRPVRATARQEHPRRRVGVVAQEAANDPNVLGSERRPTRGHGVRHARNVGGHDVGVPLDDHHPVVGGDRLLGQVEAVQELRLLVDGGLGGVEVLRGVLLRLVQPSRPEADGRARDVADRPHQAPAEAIVDAPGALRGQARDLDFLVREALGTQVAGQSIPGGRGVANPKVRAH